MTLEGAPASPQLENGYTRLANEIIEALMKTNLSAYQSRILWAIWRQTYGYQKKKDWISNEQLIEMTGLSKQHINRTKKQLLQRNMITKSGSLMAFNKDYTQWKELPKQNTVANSGYEVANRGYQVASLGDPSSLLRRPQKKKLSLKKKKNFPPDSIEFKLSDLLFSLIRKQFPKAKEPDLQSWARHVDLLIRVDGHDASDIERIIRRCQADAFWYKNILSTEKLREKFHKLCLDLGGSNGTGEGSTGSSTAFRGKTERKRNYSDDAAWPTDDTAGR